MGKLPVVKNGHEKNILFILFLCSFKLVCAQDSNFLWVKQFGGTGTSGANSMELDALFGQSKLFLIFPQRQMVFIEVNS